MEVRLQPVKLYIAASVSSWNYSVGGGYGWVVLSLADLEGVPWVPWNPSFEELASKIRKHTTSTSLPLQLGMAICYQYESAYFPVPNADNQLFCSLWSEAESHL